LDYQLKFGVVTDGRHTPSDAHPEYGPNYYQVKVLPDMNDIEDLDEITKDAILPRYPTFFADDHRAYQPGDSIWIVCDADYSVGFIIGLASSPSGNPVSTHVQALNQAEVNAGLPVTGLNEATISKVSEHCITFSNEKTGVVTQIFSSKIVYIYAEDGSIDVSNGGTFHATISSSGEISVSGKQSNQVYVGDISVNAANSIEKLASKNIDTMSDITLNAGGNVTVVSGSNSMYHTVMNEEHVIGGSQKTTVGSTIERNVTVGVSGLPAIKDSVVMGDYNISVGVGGVNIVAGLGIKLSSPTSIELTAPLISFTRTAVNTIPINFIQGFQSGASVFSIPIPAIASPLAPLFFGMNILDLVWGLGATILIPLGFKWLFDQFISNKDSAPTTIPFTLITQLVTGSKMARIKPTSGLIVGLPVSGDGIPANTVIEAINPDVPYEFTLSNKVGQLSLNGNRVNSASVEVDYGPYTYNCGLTTGSNEITVPSSTGLLGTYITGLGNGDGTFVRSIKDATTIIVNYPSYRVPVVIPPNMSKLQQREQGIHAGDTTMVYYTPPTGTYPLTFQSKNPIVVEQEKPDPDARNAAREERLRRASM
jgi:hypothetical protein